MLNEIPRVSGSTAMVDDAKSVRYITIPAKTAWKNPTSHVQKVQVRVNNRTDTITWQPGETKEISSEFNVAIQKVRCSVPECRSYGDGHCRLGHPGSIQSGSAPLLVRVGVETTLAPGLDPEVAVKKQAAEELAVATRTATMAAEILTRPAPSSEPAQVPTLGGGKKG